MDENQNSLLPWEVENSQAIQHLLSGLEKIVINPIDSKQESDVSRRRFKNVRNPLFFANHLADSVPNVSLEYTEDIGNNDVIMLSTDVPSSSKSQEHAAVSKGNTQYQTKQNIAVQPTQNEDLQLTLRNFAGNESEHQNNSYKSYSNLIKMCCTKCKLLSKCGVDNICYKCKSSLQFQCIKCNGLYKEHIAVLNHIKYECYKLPCFYCAICTYTTYRKSNLVIHIQQNHLSLDKSEYSYHCSVCKKKFKNQKFMLKHEKFCDREATLVCQYCPYKTKSNQVLVQHVQKKHQQSTTDNHKRSKPSKKYSKCSVRKFLKCNHCHFETVTKLSLVEHLQKKHPFVL